MIRTSLPAPPARQIAQRFEALTHRTRRALDQRRRTPASSSPNDARLMANWRAEVARKRKTFSDFDNHFNELVETVCDAAQDAITPAREESYRDERAWLIRHYATVKRELGRYLDTDVEDSAPGLWGQPRPCDAFEAMFLPKSLKTLLAQDGGQRIGQMVRTQNAVMAYADELRRAEADLPLED